MGRFYRSALLALTERLLPIEYEWKRRNISFRAGMRLKKVLVATSKWVYWELRTEMKGRRAS